MEGKFMDNLFSNPGKKIKEFAKYAYLMEGIVATLFALISFINSWREFGDFLFAVLACALGWGAAYYSNLLLYGFGELVESTTYAKKTSEQLATDSYETMKEIDELPEI